MRKLIIAAVAAGTLAVPAVSMAAAPNGDYVFKASAGNGNVVATDSSQIKQNGQFVSQQAQAGDRSDIVQGLLGHTN